MDPKLVIVVTWIVAGLVVAAYIWFVVWRYRVERRKKEAEAITDGAMSDAIARTAQRLAAAEPVADAPTVASAPAETDHAAETPVPSPAASTRPTPEVGLAASHPLRTDLPAPAPTPLSPTAEVTVASLLAGIALPRDLAPLTTLSPRPAVGDRVAFWTDRAPAEVVGPEFANELERLGYSVVPLDERSLSVQRGADRLVVVIHPDGARAIIGDQFAFSTVPELSVVIEVWVPA